MSACAGFAPIHDAWSADLTEDVDFYVELASEADGPVSDRRRVEGVASALRPDGRFAWNAF